MIQVERVYKSFSEPVLRGCNLRLVPGEMTGLIGPPASGKSTLLHTIAGLVEPDAGSVLHYGQEITRAEPGMKRRLQAGIGMLFQNIALFDFMTVGENLAFVLRRMGGQTNAQIEQRVEQELTAVGLAGFAERNPRELSGGQRRRVGIARAAIARPRVLLYDEPAAGLDPVSSSRAFQLLRAQLQRQRTIMLVISSDIDRLLPAVDRAYVMMEGRITAQGTHAELREHEDASVRQFIEGSVDGPL